MQEHNFNLAKPGKKKTVGTATYRDKKERGVYIKFYLDQTGKFLTKL